MSLNFGAIISRSFDIAWRYKSLWIFGLFTGAGSRGLNLDLPDSLMEQLPGSGFEQDFEETLSGWDPSVVFDTPFIVTILLFFLILALVFLACYLIAQPAIIDAVNKITRGGQYRFSESFSRGIDFMWRILGLAIVWFMAGLALVFAVVIIAVITPWSLLMTIPIAIVVGFFLWHTFSLAQVALVARDGSIGDAIVEGWELLNRNKANCLIVSFLMIGIGIGFMIAITIVSLFTFVPIGLMVGLLTGNLVAVLLLGLIIGLPISIVLGGVTGTFFNALYVQFYFKLYEPEPTDLATGQAYPSV